MLCSFMEVSVVPPHVLPPCLGLRHFGAGLWLSCIALFFVGSPGLESLAPRLEVETVNHELRTTRNH
jgi:hypothetical protein